MAAYRVLSLTKDFLEDLRGKTNWRSSQLEPGYRGVLIGTLLAIHDTTARRRVLDMHVCIYQPFFELIKDDGPRRFARANYFCARSLLEWVETESGHAFLTTNEYPSARLVIGLYGGVSEAILAGKLSTTGSKTLGALVREAHKQGHLVVGTRLCAFVTILPYLRNQVHPDGEIQRTDYLLNLNVAKGVKAATDLVLADSLGASLPRP